MQNPILEKFWRLIFFILLLTVPIFVYYTDIRSYSFVGANYYILDSIISYIIVGFMSLALWYYIRFSTIENDSLDKILIRYVVLWIVLTTVWVLLISFIFIFVFPDKSEFKAFSQITIKTKYIYSFVIFGIMILYYNIVIKQRRNAEKKEESMSLETMLQQEKLNNLKSQINPHFLFNSLNSISYLIYENQDNAHEAIVKLADYFRYSLSLSKNQFTKVADEIENIKRYFEIEEIRFPHKMKIDFKIDKECEKYKIPVLILQPLAENAVKYGVYENIDISKINIAVEDNQDYYRFEITNNFDQENTNKKGTGTGIENVRKRLSLIYQRDDLLKINKTEEWFQISINFPKHIKNA